MKIIYHRQITQQAIESQVSRRTLDVIINANIGQDSIRYQVGHDHFHFDSSAFAQGNDYVESQHKIIQPALAQGNPQWAWQAFGRLSHAAQDFYAHSNYVALWLAKKNGVNRAPEQIDPLDQDILMSRDLHSGTPHLFDLLLYMSLLPASWLKLAPKNSHLAMNIDGPDRLNFDFVFSAAVMRTRSEFARALNNLPADLGKAFTDL
jgi:hypothetical protein